ncbi:MAG: hypothetical protein ACKOCD_01505 [Nitrospiraceae bacterium]
MVTEIRTGTVVFVICLALSGLQAIPAPAETRTVTATGEYRMGNHDTRADAVRLATEDAKRHALEQVASYLENVTEVTNLQVTADDIRTYTAGVVLVLNQQISTRLDGDTVVIHADLTAQVDPDEVVQAITALRENEDANRELVALRTENDQLRQQLEVTNQALASAPAPEQIQALSQQRQAVLNQMQSNALLSQTWTEWVLVAWPTSPLYGVGLGQVQSLLTQAIRLHPANPHVRVIQRIIPAQSGPPQGGPTASASVPSQHAPPAPLPPTLHQVYPPQGTYIGPHVRRAPYMWHPSYGAPRGGGGHGHHRR